MCPSNEMGIRQSEAAATPVPETFPDQAQEQAPEQAPEQAQEPEQAPASDAPEPAAEETSTPSTAETASPGSVRETSAAAERPSVQQSLRVTPGVCQVCKSTSKVVLIEQQTIASGSITIPGTYLCQSCIDDQPASTDWKVWMQWRQRKGGA